MNRLAGVHLFYGSRGNGCQCYLGDRVVTGHDGMYTPVLLIQVTQVYTD